MAETDNIAKLATPVSEEMFKVFGWTSKKPVNQNLQCKTEAHKKETHPVDVVFWYDHPYQKERIYLNTDLKSYKKTSISKPKILGYLNTLSMAVECADKNEDWQTMFVDSNHNFKIVGLLFLFNHDGEYDLSLTDKFVRISEKDLNQRKDVEVHLLSPTVIRYLMTVCIDIRQTFTTKAKPSEKTYQFYYPNLITQRAQRQYWNSATIETILGPWQIIRFVDKDDHSENIRVYSTSKGSTDECKYLIDYLFRYQLIGKDQKISIRLPLCEENAVINFENAKEEYFSHFFGSLAMLPDALNLKESIKLDRIETISQRFFTK